MLSKNLQIAIDFTKQQSNLNEFFKKVEYADMLNLDYADISTKSGVIICNSSLREIKYALQLVDQFGGYENTIDEYQSRISNNEPASVLAKVLDIYETLKGIKK